MLFLRKCCKHRGEKNVNNGVRWGSGKPKLEKQGSQTQQFSEIHVFTNKERYSFQLMKVGGLGIL